VTISAHAPERRFGLRGSLKVVRGPLITMHRSADAARQPSNRTARTAIVTCLILIGDGMAI